MTGTCQTSPSILVTPCRDRIWYEDPRRRRPKFREGVAASAKTRMRSLSLNDAVVAVHHSIVEVLEFCPLEAQAASRGPASDRGARDIEPGAEDHVVAGLRAHQRVGDDPRIRWGGGLAHPVFVSDLEVFRAGGVEPSAVAAGAGS